MMKIKSIRIDRPASYDSDQAFRGEICIEGGQLYPADITIKIPAEHLVQIVEIITASAIKAMQASAREFEASAFISLQPSEMIENQRLVEDEY